MKFPNSEYHLSLFKSLLTTEPDTTIDINQLYEAIKYGYLKDIILELRSSLAKDEYDDIKKNEIPAITLSGEFSQRNNKSLIKHSGLIQVDIDEVDNYEQVFSILCEDQFTYLCFKSPGGKGIKAVVKIFPSAETHKQQFLALEKYYKETYGLSLDPLCKDLSRCMLLSYDPEIYCNPHSSLFEQLEKKPEKKQAVLEEPRPVYLVPAKISGETEDLVERITTALLDNGIDITNSYDNWIRVGFALCTTLGEQGRSYFHRIGSMHPHYSFVESEREYSSLLAKNNGSIKLGTLVRLARLTGIPELEASYQKNQPSLTEILRLIPEIKKGDDPLNKLMELREYICAELHLSKAKVFSDNLLWKFAEILPVSWREFKAIPGVRADKLDLYHEYFREVTRKFRHFSPKP